MKRFVCVILMMMAGVAGAVHYVPPQKYNQAFTLHFSLYDSNSPWQYYETAPAADDVYIRKDGGSAARATNAVTDLNHTMSLLLTATEMSAAVVTVDVNDETSPPLFGSDTWVIYTHGNASAQNAFDLDSATVTPGTASITAAVLASNCLTSDELDTTFIDEFENDVISNNNTKHSLAWYIKRASGSDPVPVEPDATAQAGGTTNTIVLAAASSATNNAYVPMLVELTSGTGAPANATIVAYNGTSKVATVSTNWPGASPDQTTHYKLTASPTSSFAHEGLAQAGDGTTITLATEAPSTSSITGFIVLRSGTGAPDTQEISSYNGSTKVLTVASWSGDSPSTDTYYALIPSGNIASDTPEPTPGLTITDVQDALTAQGMTTTWASNVGALPTTIGTPGDTDFVTDVNNVAVNVDALIATIGTPGDTDFVTDVNNIAVNVDAILTDTDAITGSYDVDTLYQLLWKVWINLP